MLQVHSEQRRLRSPSVASYNSAFSYESYASSTQVHPRSIYSFADSDRTLETETDSILTTDAERASLASTDLDSFGGYHSEDDRDDDRNIFYALALFSFTSEDPDHMPFHKGDILAIVTTEPSGWWAAEVGDTVGWVPSGYLAWIPPRILQRLVTLAPEMREYEYNAEVLYEGEEFAQLTLDDDVLTLADTLRIDESGKEIRQGIEREVNKMLEEEQTVYNAHNETELPLTISDLHSPRGFPTEVTPAAARFNLPPNLPSQPSPPHNSWAFQPLRSHPYGITPPTPKTPVPPKVPAPAPVPTSVPVPGKRFAGARGPGLPAHPSLKVNTNRLPIDKNKPTPPTPRTPNPIGGTPSSFSASVSVSSSSSASSLSSFIPRSRSLGSPAVGPPSTTSSRSSRRPFDTPSTTTPGSSYSPSSARTLPSLFEHHSTADTVITSPNYTASPGNIDDYDFDDDIDIIDDNVGVRRSSSTTAGDKVRRLTGDDQAQAFANAKKMQALLPWYLKPVHDGDEIRIEPDGSVRAGTLEALVERLTVELLRPELEETFRKVFLTTFHAFTTADRILDLLIDRYQIDAPAELAEDQFEEWKLKKLMPSRARVLFTFKVWIEKYGLMEDDPHIIPRLREFLELIHSPPAHAQNAKALLLEMQRHRNSSRPLSSPILSAPPPRKHSRRHRNELLRLDHSDLARQLTLYEARLYLKVRPHECLTWATAPKSDGVKNLRAFVATSDKLAAWVKMSVLGNDALGKRADTIDMWIKVAEKCRILNNYSSMSAIVAALTSQVIAKLQLTWAHVNRASHIEPLIKLSQPVNNFAAFRNAFRSVEGPCLPYLGIYLSDMVRVAEPLPDTIKVPITDPELLEAAGGAGELKLINFWKYQRMADITQYIIRHQPKVREWKIPEVQPTMQFVESQLALAAQKDEGGFWMRSQEVQHAELAHADIRKGLEAAGF
ncbi:hypothetical protein M422DRAFT_241434 [Sphaerobolus stellatus SS14]|nr:hypothetical protein M422DRAFT_241434 [Sphaerobolus stellatus SS14]